MNPKLEETITLDFITSNASTGAASDADATPTAEVFEDTTDTTVYALTCTKRTGKTGNYRVSIACTAANGFEVGKSYNVVASATVATVAAKANVGSFQVRAITPDDVYSRIGAAGAGLTAVVAASVAGAVGSVTGSVGSVTGAVGSVTGNVGGNVVGSVASVTAGVTVAVNGDKIGYSLTAAEHTAIAADVLDAAAAAHVAAGTIGAKIGGASTYAGGDTPGTTTLLARLTDPRAVNLDKLDVATSTLSTYSGGPVASVTAPVTAGNLPADYQQRGIAVTLPDPAPAGYGGASAGQVAAAVLATPANLLATDVTGRVTVGTNADKAGYALAGDGVDAVVIEPTVNLRQAVSVILAGQGGILTGAGTATVTIQGGRVTDARITATVDSAGNRSAVTLNPPA